MPQSASEASDVVRRLKKIPGVVGARLERVCCDPEGKGMLFIGIEEKGAPHVEYRAPPTTAVSLPPEMIAKYHRFQDAWEEAVRKGDTGDDLSHGHSLAANPAVRAVQEQFPAYAAAHLETLRHVLRSSADPEQRQIATWIIGYAPKKRDVVEDRPPFSTRSANEPCRHWSRWRDGRARGTRCRPISCSDASLGWMRRSFGKPGTRASVRRRSPEPWPLRAARVDGSPVASREHRSSLLRSLTPEYVDPLGKSRTSTDGSPENNAISCSHLSEGPRLPRRASSAEDVRLQTQSMPVHPPKRGGKHRLPVTL